MTRMRINPLRQELQCLDQRAKHQARSVRHITAWILGVLDVLDYVTWALAATKPYSPRIPRRVDGVRPLSDRRSRARNTTALACAVTCLTRPKPHCRPFRRSLRHQWPRSSVARERARSGDDMARSSKLSCPVKGAVAGLHRHQAEGLASEELPNPVASQPPTEDNLAALRLRPNDGFANLIGFSEFIASSVRSLRPRATP